MDELHISCRPSAKYSRRTSSILPMTRPVTIGGLSGKRRTSSFKNSLVDICRCIGYPQFLTRCSMTDKASNDWFGLRELT